MGWWIVLGIVALLAVLPVGISAGYDSGGVLLRAIAGPLKITLYPRKQKAKKEKETAYEEKKPKESTLKKPEPVVEKKKGGSITDFLPLVHVALDFLGEMRRKLRVKRLEMKLIMAGGDPCDLAVNYGKAWAVLGNLIPLLERAFVIRKRKVEVECDFTAEQTLVIARLDLTITIGRIVSLAFRYGFRAVREYLTIKNKRKGGAEK